METSTKNQNEQRKPITSNKMHLLVLAFYISKTRKSNEEQQKETNGKWKHAPKTKTSNKEQQIAFFIPILIHSHQFWTYGRWLISRAMKSQKEQRRATKSNEKAAKSYEQQQKATTDIGAGKTKTGKNNREEQRKAQKVQRKPGLSGTTRVTLTWADRYVLFCGPMFVPALLLSQSDFMVK